MFLLLFSLISFQSIIKVKPNLNAFNTHFSFGFEKGGNYSVKIKDCKFDELLFVIAPEEEMNKCDKTKMINDSCYLQFKNSQHLKIINESAELSGNINKKGIYMTRIIHPYSSKNVYNINFKYQNPNSYSSYNYVEYIPFNRIIILISCILMTLWIINWIQYFFIGNIIHFMFSIAFVLYILEKVTFDLLLQKAKVSDDYRKIYNTHFLLKDSRFVFLSESVLMLLCDNDNFFSFIDLFIFLFVLFTAILFIDINSAAKNYVFSFLLIFFIMSLIYIHHGYILSSRNEEHNYTRKPTLFLWFTLFYIDIANFVTSVWIMDVYFPCYMLFGIEFSCLFLLFLIGYFYRLKKSTMKNYRTIDDEQSQPSEL